jgi:hypothetical protein
VFCIGSRQPLSNIEFSGGGEIRSIFEELEDNIALAPALDPKLVLNMVNITQNYPIRSSYNPFISQDPIIAAYRI